MMMTYITQCVSRNCREWRNTVLLLLTAAQQPLTLVLEPRTFWSHTSPACSKRAPRSVAM